MKHGSRFLFSFLLFIAIPGFLAAQEAQPQVDEKYEQWLPEVQGQKPPLHFQHETPEERRERLAMDEDPGPNPDPTRVWRRRGRDQNILKFARRTAYYDLVPYGFVRPLWAVNITAEIYQENEEYVWVWFDVPEKVEEKPVPPPVSGPSLPAPSPIQPGEILLGENPNTEVYKLEGEQLEFVKVLKKEMSEVVPPESDVVLRFRESSAGLPEGGSWRNGLDVGDMNGDGHLDIVIPPQRGGFDHMTPFIFLGNGKGEWTLWETVVWPRGYNYGTVAVADLNRDGHMDIAVAAHLSGVYVALGDGKGNFRDASEGLDQSFPTRRLVIRDLNGDGHQDIIAISEGPTMGGTPVKGGPIKAFINDGKAAQWKNVDVAEPLREVAGDWLAVGDFTGNGKLDVAGASTIMSGTDLMYLQEKDGVFRPFGRGWLPFYSYYTALTSGKFTHRKRDDLILSYGRFWPPSLDPESLAPPEMDRIVGIDRVWFDGKNWQRAPIVRWPGEYAIWGLATGDFNGDGHLDLVYAKPPPMKLEFLLGDGKGGFRSARSEGLDLPDLTLYDIKIADVNRDGADDIMIMFERGDRAGDGSVKVWLGTPGPGRRARNGK
ncbi:MAG TPA: VCBS repeat-containing protein [Thermoanaerobaculia bacterium]|nr:VCBS repeat-containing protein [Thermoanaerobaculia bacterium]